MLPQKPTTGSMEVNHLMTSRVVGGIRRGRRSRGSGGRCSRATRRRRRRGAREWSSFLYGVLRTFQWGFSSYRDFIGWSTSVPGPAPSARFNLMRFLVPGAAGAVRKGFLGASLVCLRSRPSMHWPLGHNLKLTHSQPIGTHIQPQTRVRRGVRSHARVPF